MSWKTKAINLLRDSLYPIPSELNEIDWKSGLSSKTDRVAQHLCAFSNQAGGGYFVFGVNDNASMFSVAKEEADDNIRKIGNIARNNLVQPILIQHATETVNGYSLLFVHVPESADKPTYMRGGTIYDTYRRSAGQTVKMTRQEVKQLIAEAHGISFDEQIAHEQASADEVLNLLNYDCYFQLSGRSFPENKTAILDMLANEKFIIKQGDKWGITNLGALLFARDLTHFNGLEYKTLRIVLYTGKNRIEAYPEQNFKEGYACGFEHFVQFIMERTSIEVIDKALRQRKETYPEQAIREFLANALIHQNLWQNGMYVMVEIFSDRIEMTNPGAPLVDVNRFIDTPPKSRNERIALLMRLFDICEQRGSGVDRAIMAIENAFLPAPEFVRGEDCTKVFIYPKKTFAQMTKEDRIRACYQHCCLKYMEKEKMTNQSFRERMGIEEKNYPMVSKLIKETCNTGLIKEYQPENKSRKFTSYIPYWA